MDGKLDSHHLQPVEFQPGDYLCRKGDATTHFFLIDEGKVEVFSEDDLGEKIPLALVGEGQAIGEFAFVVKKTRSAHARALTTVKALRVSEQGYKELLDGLPFWALSLIESLVERLGQADEIIRKHRIIDEELVTSIGGVNDSET